MASLMHTPVELRLMKNEDGKRDEFYLSTWHAVLDAEIPWERRNAPRRECFMAMTPRSYTYGRGAGERTYHSKPAPPSVVVIWEQVEKACGVKFDGCFANGYADERQHLGWHSDDLGGTDHTRPIAVVSYGAAREIWFRPKPFEHGAAQQGDSLMLVPGSLLIMKPGMQLTHQHRIPKHFKKCGDRISLTFRGFV